MPPMLRAPRRTGSLKTSRIELDIVNAYRATGSYRSAAALCGPRTRPCGGPWSGSSGVRSPAGCRSAGSAGPTRSGIWSSGGSGVWLGGCREAAATCGHAAGYTGSDRTLRRNGGTKAINLLIEKARRLAHGQRTYQRARSPRSGP